MSSAHKHNQKYGGVLLIICAQILEVFCKIKEV